MWPVGVMSSQSNLRNWQLEIKKAIDANATLDVEQRESGIRGELMSKLEKQGLAVSSSGEKKYRHQLYRLSQPK
jgi:hypothetical protein